MARLIMTNDENKFQNMKHIAINQGFDDYIEYMSNNCCLSAHKKKIKKIQNAKIYHTDNGSDNGFCVITGTCIYKDIYFGVDAIDKIYSDFSGDIDRIRENSMGNYVISIKKKGSTYVFTDKYSILHVYYLNYGEKWFIANALDLIGHALDNIELHEFSLMQEAFLYGHIGNQSVFRNVYKLMGHEYILIDSDMKLNIGKIPYHRRKRDFRGENIEAAAKEYAELIKSKFEVINKHFGNNIRIHQTGGIDNRTIFAALMSVGCKPKTMYGIGNSILTNTKKEDFTACKTYAEKFNLDFYTMNWENNDTFNIEKLDKMFNRYGFNYRLYGNNESFFAEYEGLIPNYPDFMECGCFLENLRLREFIRDYGKETITLEDFVDKYLFYGMLEKKGFYNNYNALKNYTMDNLRSYMALLGIDDEITIENFDEVRWIQARVSDSMMANMLNDYTSSFAVFSIPELHEFPFDVPSDWRAYGKFQMRTIYELYPPALEVPVFSRCQSNIFDKETFSLIPIESPLTKFVRITKRILPVFLHPLLKKLRIRFINNPDTSENCFIRQSLIEIINDDSKDTGTFINTNFINVDIDIRLLMYYALYLHGAKLLKEQLSINKYN